LHKDIARVAQLVSEGAFAEVLRHALRAAKAVIQQADHVQLSGRDSVRVLALLENPPAPNAKLLAAARVLPKRRS